MITNRNQLLILLKEKYEYELQRKNYFETILNIPVTMLGLLSGGTFYLLNTNDIGCRMWYANAKPFLIAALLILGIVSIYFIFSVLFGFKREYKTFPNSDEVNGNFSLWSVLSPHHHVQ